MRGRQDGPEGSASRAAPRHGRHRDSQRPRWGIFTRSSAVTAAVLVIGLGAVAMATDGPDPVSPGSPTASYAVPADDVQGVARVAADRLADRPG
ncbi:hypothetical protein [Actinomadura nitritigenes]|uniref:hypothetical protein n=1 Tax=Actinomadura nitritigenes TaxID=134602 RepID=UPI003D90EF89